MKRRSTDLSILLSIASDETEHDNDADMDGEAASGDLHDTAAFNCEPLPLLYKDDDDARIREVTHSIANFGLGKSRGNFYTMLQRDVGMDKCLYASSTSADLVGKDVYMFRLSSIFMHSALLCDLAKLIREANLKVVHMFSGDVDWTSLGVPSGNVYTNDYSMSSKATSHEHPAIFLRRLLQEKGKAWADIVIYSAPSNQYLLKKYLSAGGRGREEEFHRINKSSGVKQGDAGLASTCKTLLAELLHGKGQAVTVSYKTTGFGMSMGFAIEKLWVIPHGVEGQPWGAFACHDTFVVVEKREKNMPTRVAVHGSGVADPNIPPCVICRTWSMYAAGGETYSVDAIRAVLERTLAQVHKHCSSPVIVDPFARRSKYGTLRNDLNRAMPTHHHFDAVEFLNRIRNGEIEGVSPGAVDVVLLDPPYSDIQSGVCYQSAGVASNSTYTINVELYRQCKEVIAHILRPGGLVLTFGWSSVGMCNDLFKFRMIEVAVVCHGAAHDDTIITVEQKLPTND